MNLVWDLFSVLSPTHGQVSRSLCILSRALQVQTSKDSSALEVPEGSQTNITVYCSFCKYLHSLSSDRPGSLNPVINHRRTVRCTTHPRRPAGTWSSHRSHGHSSMGPRSHRLAPGSLVCSSLEEHQQQGGFANAVWMVLFQPSTGHPDTGSFEDLPSLTSYPLSKDSPFPQHLLWTTMYSFGFLHHIFILWIHNSFLLSFVSPGRHETMVF